MERIYTYNQASINTGRAYSDEQLNSAMEISGITNTKLQPSLNLTGDGILIGIVGVGMDVADEDFMYSNGESRIIEVFSQESNEEITDEADNDLTRISGASDNNLMRIAAGNGGAANNSTIISVKLKEADRTLREFYGIDDDVVAFSEESIIAGISYIYEKAKELNKPCVIFMPLSSNMGSHDGVGRLNDALKYFALMPNVCVITTTGSEANTGHHFRGFIDSGVNLTERKEDVESEIRVLDANIIYLEIWVQAPNIITISIISPTGDVIEQIPVEMNAKYEFNLLLDNTRVEIENVVTGEGNRSQLIKVRLITPRNGIWMIRYFSLDVLAGDFNVWLPNVEFIGRENFFLKGDPDITLNNASTGSDVLSVGTYNLNTGGIEASSGRGFARIGTRKPDICAPLIGVMGNESAAALSVGAAALYMEWACVKGNSPMARTLDLSLFLVRGANRERIENYPSKAYGFGKLDLYNSFRLL